MILSSSCTTVVYLQRVNHLSVLDTQVYKVHKGVSPEVQLTLKGGTPLFLVDEMGWFAHGT